jgi:hypothetical protein
VVPHCRSQLVSIVTHPCIRASLLNGPLGRRGRNLPDLTSNSSSSSLVPSCSDQIRSPAQRCGGAASRHGLSPARCLRDHAGPFAPCRGLWRRLPSNLHPLQP